MCEHSWRRVRGVRGDAGACEQPSRVVCLVCSEWFPARCQSGRADRCVYCSTLKRGDLAAVVRSGVLPSSSGDSRVGALVALVTLTAPGADVLGWDQGCGHQAGECSGSLGCRVARVPLAAWHAGLAKRWSYFRQELRRALPGCDVQFCKSYELQARGAVHVHAVVRVEGVCTVRRFKAAVRAYRTRNGFGRQYDVTRVEGLDPSAVARTAGYVAKYIAKAYGELRGVEVLDFASGSIERKGLRPWSASRGWGETMRACRERRAAFFVGGGAHGVPGAPADDSGGVAAGLTCSEISPQLLVDSWGGVNVGSLLTAGGCSSA